MAKLTVRSVKIIHVYANYTLFESPAQLGEIDRIDTNVDLDAKDCYEEPPPIKGYSHVVVLPGAETDIITDGLEQNFCVYDDPDVIVDFVS